MGIVGSEGRGQDTLEVPAEEVETGRSRPLGDAGAATGNADAAVNGAAWGGESQVNRADRLCLGAAIRAGDTGGSNAIGATGTRLDALGQRPGDRL